MLWCRGTWGICTLIWNQERVSILYVHILLSKGGAESQKQTTNYQYAKIASFTYLLDVPSKIYDKIAIRNI